MSMAFSLISDESKFTTHTDDMSLYFTSTKPDKILATAKTDLFSLKEWNDLNDLTIQLNKSKAVLLWPQNSQVNPHLHLYLSNSEVEIGKEIKSLDGYSTEHLY